MKGKLDGGGGASGQRRTQWRDLLGHHRCRGALGAAAVRAGAQACRTLTAQHLGAVVVLGLRVAWREGSGTAPSAGWAPSGYRGWRECGHSPAVRLQKSDAPGQVGCPPCLGLWLRHSQWCQWVPPRGLWLCPSGSSQGSASLSTRPPPPPNRSAASL